MRTLLVVTLLIGNLLATPRAEARLGQRLLSRVGLRARPTVAPDAAARQVGELAVRLGLTLAAGRPIQVERLIDHSVPLVVAPLAGGGALKVRATPSSDGLGPIAGVRIEQRGRLPPRALSVPSARWAAQEVQQRAEHDARAFLDAVLGPRAWTSVKTERVRQPLFHHRMLGSAIGDEVVVTLKGRQFLPPDKSVDGAGQFVIKEATFKQLSR